MISMVLRADMDSSIFVDFRIKAFLNELFKQINEYDIVFPVLIGLLFLEFMSLII